MVAVEAFDYDGGTEGACRVEGAAGEVDAWEVLDRRKSCRKSGFKNEETYQLIRQ